MHVAAGQRNLKIKERRNANKVCESTRPNPQSEGGRASDCAKAKKCRRFLIGEKKQRDQTMAKCERGAGMS
eukprot:6201719-Pleurochrysis_carterae.AAC.2